ncbi:hypothetical protein [Clostridium sp. AM58-1XD]|uniref:hypothetical protein n=1 Tax=Clostridium sp. AM58-1XD TaxID=2292307 RepID=UPI0011C12A0B|nr:hypothetical protein [Clostridium sp. AM58-1XD]
MTIRPGVIKYLLFVAILTAVLSGCEKEKEGRTWDCTVTIPQNSDEIVLSNTVVQTDSGELSMQNHGDVDMMWFLYEIDGEAIQVEKPAARMEIKAGGAGTMFQLDRKKDYAVGIQADSPVERKVTVIVSEYPNSDPYTVEENSYEGSSD